MRFWLELAVTLLAGGFTAWLIARYVTPKRNLDYVVTDIRRVVSPTAFEKAGDLHVVLGECEVEEPHLTVVRIGNTGRQAISKEDFQGNPLKLSLRADVDGAQPRIVSVAVTETEPENLNLDFTWDDSAVLIQPVLMNRSAQFELQVLTSGRTKGAKFGGTIRDVPVIRNVDEVSVRRISNLEVGVGLIGAGSAIAAIFLLDHDDPELLLSGPAGVAFTVTSPCFTLQSLLSHRFHRRMVRLRGLHDMDDRVRQARRRNRGLR